MHAQQWSQGELIGVGVAALIIWAFFYAILRWFEREKPVEMQPDMIAESLRIVGTPTLGPGGRWIRYESRLVECEAPIVQGELVVHDKTDPEHRAVCAECRDGRKFRTSAISWREG